MKHEQVSFTSALSRAKTRDINYYEITGFKWLRSGGNNSICGVILSTFDYRVLVSSVYEVWLHINFGVELFCAPKFIPRSYLKTSVRCKNIIYNVISAKLQCDTFKTASVWVKRRNSGCNNIYRENNRSITIECSRSVLFLLYSTYLSL